MIWVEIINLRSAGKAPKEVVEEILAGVGVSDQSKDSCSHLLKTKTYYQPLVETDLSIHIYWESATESPRRSPLAVRIYSALMSMGLLDYTIWVEMSHREFSR